MAIGDVISALLPGNDRLGLMAPRRPEPADLFGPAPLPYPAEFYEKSRYAPPAFTLPTPEEMQIQRQLQQQRNLEIANRMKIDRSGQQPGIPADVPRKPTLDKHWYDEVKSPDQVVNLQSIYPGMGVF